MKLEANHNEQMAALIKKYKEKNSTNTPVNTDKKASTNKRKDKDGREINDKDDSSDKDTDSDDDDDGAAATKGVEGLPWVMSWKQNELMKNVN